MRTSTQLQAAGHRQSRSLHLTFREEEFQALQRQKELIGCHWVSIIRERLTGAALEKTVSAARLIAELDRIGSDLGRSAARINELGRYAELLTAHDKASPVINERLDGFFEDFLRHQKAIEELLIQIMAALAA